MPVHRRTFLTRVPALTAGLAAAVRRQSYATESPNETVNVAVVGIRGGNEGKPIWTSRGRGQNHYESLSALPNVRITHVVDIDERHFSTTLPQLKQQWGGNPKTEVDVRRVLDDPDVDAITIATPDHWHALMTIWACQAGKDVYVEKPVSHNVWEGRKMVEAARAHKRVVAAGTQRRSRVLTKQAVEFIKGGGLGKLHTGRCSVFRARDPIGTASDGAPPQGVHYDLWLGPAPERPFNESHFHYTWHWLWDYGTSELGNNGIHVLDALRWLMDRKEHPRAVYSVGGLYEGGKPTDQETPNTQYTTFQYADGVVLHCDVRGWYTEESDAGLYVYGSEGWMRIADGKVSVYLGRKNEPGPKIGSDEEEDATNGSATVRRDRHMENFIDCIRSRKWQELNAEILEGHMSTSLCHLGNISYRLQRSVVFDSTTERFVEDAEADALLSRVYREPFVIPSTV
jgi:predicted dehydrogenase